MTMVEFTAQITTQFIVKDILNSTVCFINVSIQKDANCNEGQL